MAETPAAVQMSSRDFLDDIFINNDSEGEIASETDSDNNGSNSDTDSDDDDDGPHSTSVWREEHRSREHSLRFTGQPGLRVACPPSSTPGDIFSLFFNDTILNKICQETNRYAEHFLSTSDLPPHSRAHKWQATTVGEIRRLIGVVLAMGLIVLDDVTDYWSRDEVLQTNFFTVAMPRDRFLLLMKFLHFNDNASQVLDRQSALFDPLYKVRPILEVIQENFAQVYTPEQRLTIDEGMVPWRGRLKFRVSMSYFIIFMIL